MEEPKLELAVPWSTADSSEVSWSETMEIWLGDLSAQQQFGLWSSIAPQPPLQMEDYLADDDDAALMDRNFGDTDLAKWVAELPKSGASNPSPSSETNILHQMEDEDMEVKLLLRGPQDELHLPATVFGLPLDHAYDIHQWDGEFYSVAGDDAREAEMIHLNHETKDYIVIMPSLLELEPTQGSWGIKSQRKCRTRSTYWKMEDFQAVAHDDAMIVPQFGDADLAEWLADLSTPPHSLANIVYNQMEDEIKLLLMWSPGLLDHGTHKVEDKSDSIHGDKAIIAKQHSGYEKEDCIAVQNLLDFLPMQGNWGGHAQRNCRKRSTSWRAQISYLFGSQKPVSSGATKFRYGRKNNKHWTPFEAKKLVKGISKYGVGKWVAVKRAYFKRSFRMAVHLKDKWRDLLRACGIQVSSKKKVQPQKGTLWIVEGLKDEIINLHKKHAAQQRRTSR